MSAPLLHMAGIEKSFPGVRALREVDLTLRAGEILALMGENGAGKSTLIKILGGAITPDRGQIAIAGQTVRLRSPTEARRLGIAVIYQEFNLVPGLSATENIFLGREPTRHGLIVRETERQQATRLLQQLGLDFDPERRCRDLSVAHQQAVEIARSLSLQARVLVLDEPSAALSPREVERLFAVLRQLQAHGMGIIYIGHRLEEIFGIANRVMVLRDGAKVDDRPVSEFTRTQLIEKMVGRELKDEFPRRVPRIGPARLTVRGLRRGQAVRGVSFSVGGGEIVALTGLVGAGRTEVARLIFGADRGDAGEIEFDGRPLRIRGPCDAIAAGIGLLTEDRKQQGLVLAHAARHNFALPNLDRLARAGFVRQAQERDEFRQFIDKLQLRLVDPQQKAGQLSGGNQQKLVLAKWLARRCEVLIFDEPTRGIDVGAKFEIYKLMNELADQGKALLLISSELPEVLGMADRILVMHDGRVTGEITNVRAATQQQIL
ncbi:MAG TPA: sugar ABC transporter ATP-binding protein, partial [Candidatus Dormibacteraeota bacterium]|nr:sugar ABC transporter ATP-binding protein [Candidatus Dormibacteraeota bacterium]